MRPGEAAFVYRDQWWLVRVRATRTFPVWDAFLQRELQGSKTLDGWQAESLYGSRWAYAAARKALTRKEVLQLGLKRKRLASV